MMTKSSVFALTMTLILKRLIRRSTLSRRKQNMLALKILSGMMFRRRRRKERHLRRNMLKKSAKEYRQKNVSSAKSMKKREPLKCNKSVFNAKRNENSVKRKEKKLDLQLKLSKLKQN